MDRTAIRELYAFLDFAWRQVTDHVSAAGEDAFGRAAPGSGWPAVRDCLAHVVAGYDRWLAIMAARPESGWADGLQSLAEVTAARTAARGEVDALLDGLGDDELAAVRDFVIDGVTMPYSFAELLTHLALHERGHHGDMTTLFYQLGMEIDRPIEYRFHLQREPRA